jgi:outer membrane protein OmpA-like peptidoglycan-associated protein
MRKALLWLVAGLFLISVTAQAQNENLPPNPVPGKCYVKCITKDVFRMVEETIEIAPAYKTLRVIPGTYRTVEERVIVKEASKRLVYVPAVYKTVEVSYVAKDAGSDFTIVPAAFGKDSKIVEMKPATSGWTYTLLADCPSVNKDNCIVVCYVDYPAKKEKFEITTLVKDASSSSVPRAASTSTYAKQVIETPARMEEYEIAAEYAMIEKQIIDTPARTEEVTIPAKFQTITRSVLEKKGGQTIWEEVDCNLVGNYNLLPILYDYDSAVLTPAAKKIIDDKLLILMLDKPHLSIELASHTDSRGDDDYNMVLSQERAQSVVDYLILQGISRDRLIARGFGETRLKNKCGNGVECTEAEHQVNRRTEFRIIGN